MLLCQGLASVGTVFPITVCNGLLTVKGFPKHTYVKTVNGLITIITMSKICCVVTRLAVSYCCCFAYVSLRRYTDFSENHHVFLSGGPAVGMTEM